MVPTHSRTSVAAADWDFMKDFSPYHLVDPNRPYPPVLLLASKDDHVVHPAHSRKMAALLTRSGKKAYYFESQYGGHVTNNYKRALAYHFMWQATTSPQFLNTAN